MRWSRHERCHRPAISPNPVASRLRREFHIDGIVQGSAFALRLWAGAAPRPCRLCVERCQRRHHWRRRLPEQLTAFARELRELAPPLSRIDHFSERDLPLAHDPDFDGQFHSQFRIKASQQQSAATVAISPDQGMCEACARDVANPNDRHHRYPLPTAPTAARATPSSAASPTTAPHRHGGLAMCPRCAAAYENPLDRRYHAQPVSCPECGPHLSWRSGRGDALAERGCAAHRRPRPASGGADCGQGNGGYHLICDARSESAVARLRQLKRRARKPLAVMMSSLPRPNCMSPAAKTSGNCSPLRPDPSPCCASALTMIGSQNPN